MQTPTVLFQKKWSFLGDPQPGTIYVNYFTELGLAEGCFDSEFGYEVTVYPRRNRPHALFEGGGVPHKIRLVNGGWLWPVEQAVYEKERRKSLGAMIEKLGLMKMLPRRHKDMYRVEPLPEDFEFTHFPEEEAKAVEKEELKKAQDQMRLQQRPQCRCHVCECTRTIRADSKTGRCTPCQLSKHQGRRR